MKKVKTIFLVDDDADDRMLVSEAIRDVIEEVNIVEAASGTELIELLKGNNTGPAPAVILMDMNMPRLSGLETLSYLKLDGSYQHIPVVMISTTSDRALIGKAYEKGINAFVTKPVTTEGYLHLAQAVNFCFLNNGLTINSLLGDRAHKTQSVIVIEDSDDHWELMKLALKYGMPHVKAHRLKDKDSTLEFLDTQYNTVKPAPELILLDLYLPDRQDGLHLIEEIRNYMKVRNLKNVPIVVFSHSGYDDDVRAAYEKQANAYVVKPLDIGDWQVYFQNLCYFWSNTISLPKV